MSKYSLAKHETLQVLCIKHEAHILTLEQALCQILDNPHGDAESKYIAAEVLDIENNYK